HSESRYPGPPERASPGKTASETAVRVSGHPRAHTNSRSQSFFGAIKQLSPNSACPAAEHAPLGSGAERALAPRRYLPLSHWIASGATFPSRGPNGPGMSLLGEGAAVKAPRDSLRMKTALPVSGSTRLFAV
ncbi:hypothetical protein IscW_ISCW022807, partial [Ixodes scapularis]